MLDSILSLPMAYALAGILLLAMAVRTLADDEHPHRWGTGAFWAILGALFAWGSLLPYRVSGLLVLALVALDGFGLVGASSAPRAQERAVTGWRVVLPVLTIPLATFLVAYAFRLAGWDASRGAVVGLAAGALAGMVAALLLFRARPQLLLEEGRRLNDTVGAVSILPQLLASLGVILTAAGIGDFIARGVTALLPAQGAWVVLAVLCCFSMSLLTMLTGNSFAAFPVIATGVLLPLLIKPYGLDPALAMVLLTAGSTGTLMTPMAANFNLVPPALLDMKDAYAVIRFQIPFALAMGVAHALLMVALIAWLR
ncbi:MAG: membrane protein [Candidatus Xenobia bacterium]